MTLSELYSAVRFYTNRPQLEDATIAVWLSAATGRLNTLLSDHPRMRRTGTYTAAAQAPLIPLPYDCVRLRWLRKDSTTLRQYFSRGDTFCEEGFLEQGDCLELTHPPAENTVYTVSYHRALPVPDSSATNWVLQFFGDVYLYQVLLEAAIALKDRDNQPVWKQRADEAVAALISQGWDQNLADAPRVQIR